MHFPDIDPVAFHIGSLPIRWYGIAYLVGIITGAALARFYVRKYREFGISSQSIDNFAFWATLGVIFGGRIGFVLLYHPDYYWREPWRVLQVQNGGMSFHGGFLGVAIAAILFCRGRLGNILRLTDVISCVVPIGLFLGRIANFVNGELWGRPTSVPWAMIFPTGGPVPRHPSQLYEAALEGVVTFVIVNLLARIQRVRLSHGALTGVFLSLYGVSRIIIEQFREPDADLIWGVTRGQFYSAPMIVIGLTLIGFAWHKQHVPASA